MPEARVRSILILPAHSLWRAWTGQPPGDDEDRELSYRILATRGIRTRRIDLSRWPWNPVPPSHTLLRAIDPLRALRVLIRMRNAEIAFCIYEPAALLLVLWRGLFRSRIKIAIVDVGGTGWRLRRRIQDIVIPRADAVLPYSRSHADFIQRTWPSARHVRPVRANVDCHFFAEAPDQPDGPVLAVGDDASRDYTTLLRAIGGLDHPVVIRSRLMAQAEAPPNVTIMAQPLSMPGYRDLLAAAAIIVLPLHPFPNAGGVSVLVQAFASGKALVVSASPGIAEYMTDEVDALVVPCNDPAALRTAIERLLDDEPLRRRLAAAARARTLAAYSMEAWADQIEAEVDRLTIP